MPPSHTATVFPAFAAAANALSKSSVQHRTSALTWMSASLTGNVVARNIPVSSPALELGFGITQPPAEN